MLEVNKTFLLPRQIVWRPLLGFNSRWQKACVLAFVSSSMNVALLLHPAIAFADDYKPVGKFVYNAQTGGGSSATATSDMSTFAATIAAQGALNFIVRNNAIAAINGTQLVETNYFTPIRSFLDDVQRSQWRSDSAAAKSAATSALAKLNQLKSEHHRESINYLFSRTGNQQQVGEYGKAFMQYWDSVEKSVNEAQGVPAQIDTYIKSNQSGLRLWQEAQAYQSAAYRPGMQCSDLVIAASKKAGIAVSAVPMDGATITKTWFTQGMGPEFRQFAGGEVGVTLGQLAANEGSGEINIPLGSVIVADGHGALFQGVVKVGSEWQLITYDANDATGWTLSLAGKPSHNDQKDKMIAFPGHVVGSHVTRLQWGAGQLVKVFQPIGNHPQSDLIERETNPILSPRHTRSGRRKR